MRKSTEITHWALKTENSVRQWIAKKYEQVLREMLRCLLKRHNILCRLSSITPATPYSRLGLALMDRSEQYISEETGHGPAKGPT